MLIVDLLDSRKKSNRLALLGSCRLHDPIKAYLRSSKGAFQWSAYNSFTHTPPETAQHLAICRKDIEIPNGFSPYILRQDTAPDIPQRLPDLIETCDTFIIEMSSMDCLRCGTWYFNQDYFSQTFCRNGGLGVLQWFRELGENAPSTETIAAAIASLEATGRPITPAIEQVLHETRREYLSDEVFAQGMVDVASDRSKRWIFSPIFSLTGLSNAQNERRLKIAHIMQATTLANGLEFYDPSPMIAAVGREHALDGNGVDSFHYAPDFLDTAGEGFIRAVEGNASSFLEIENINS